MKKLILIPAFLLVLRLSAQWVEIPSGTHLHLHDIWFPGAGEAWIAADSSTLLHSTDGGDTWSQTQLAIPFTPPLVAIEFMDADTGYVLPEFGSAWVTHDGGASWAESTEFGGDACYGTQMSFGGSVQYFLQRGCFGANGFFTRTDTGMAYTLEGFPPGFELTDYLHDISWISADVAIAMGDNNLAFRTKTRGATWELLFAKDTLRDWKAITFTSPSDGWAVTGDLFEPLYHSTDAGLTWTSAPWLSTFFYPEHRSVGTSNGHVFAGGDIDWSSGGLISDLRVSDSAFTYQEVAHPVNAFHFPAPDIGFAVGDSGLILKLDSILLTAANVAAPNLHPVAFPNPATHTVTVRAEGIHGSDAEITCMDLTGRLLGKHTGSLQQGVVMPVADLPRGIYLLRVEAQGTSATIRLVLH